MKLTALLCLLALPALAHTPPLERLPAIVAAQAASPESATELNNAVVEETKVESLLLKMLGILVVPIATLLTALLGLLTMRIKGGNDRDKFHQGAGVVLDLLNSFLAKAKAELGPDLQAALADGVLDRTERELLKKKLIALLLQEAPAEAVKAVQAVFGPAFGGWLEGKAEQAIAAAAAESGAKSDP